MRALSEVVFAAVVGMVLSALAWVVWLAAHGELLAR
jgi:hypothetical protein